MNEVQRNVAALFMVYRTSDDITEKDILELCIRSIIGYDAFKRIVSTTDYPEYKESDLLDLLDEVKLMNINEIVEGFLKENSNEN